MRLFGLPHTIIGAGAIVTALVAFVVWFFGTDVTGRIVSLDVSQGKKSTYYNVHFAYTIDGIDYTENTTVPSDIYETLQVGQPYPVRIFSPIPGWMAQPRGPGSSPPLGLLFFALGWNAFLSMFLWIAWVAPLRLRSLLRHGRVTRGVVLAKEMRPGKSTTYVIRYSYQVPLDEESYISSKPETLEREMSVQREEYAAATIGQPVTVIYHPRRPRRSVIYEFSEYQAVP
jgi:hypothetical protein